MRNTLTLAALLAISAGSLAADPSPDAVLVKKGDVEVTTGEFLASIARLPEDQQFSYRADVNRITSTVSSLFMNRTLANEARAMGIDKEPEVQRRMKLAEEQFLAQIRMDRFEKSIKTPDYTARAKEVYAADTTRFVTPEKVRFRHILVSFQGRTKEEARRRAEEARAKLLANENFTRVAREYTNDPTFRGNDGVIGPAAYTVLLAPLAEAARKTPLNAVSEVIESTEGYHVISVLERNPARTAPFEEARKTLVEAEQAKFRKGIIDKKLAEITNSKDIVLYTDDIAALKTETDRDMLRQKHEEAAERMKAKAAKGG